MSIETVKTTNGWQERRAFGRRPTSIHAIALIAGRAPQHCTVRDVSEGGALLDFGEALSLPARIKVRWEALGLEATCEVCRIQGGRVGVRFEGDIGPRIVNAIAGSSTPAKAPDADATPPLEQIEPSPSVEAPQPVVKTASDTAAMVSLLRNRLRTNSPKA